MNFDFSDDQKMLKEQIRRFLEDKCSLAHAREILEGDADYSQTVWALALWSFVLLPRN
jgi:alkylation response protein AidB-like acyl-CoA dehydrogenase